METIGGIENILIDHFLPYRVERNNHFELTHTLFTVVLPVGGAVALGWYGRDFVAANSGPVIAAFTVMATVMTAIMPTIHGMVGKVDRDRIQSLKTGSVTGDENIRETKSLIAKMEVVRGLYAAVAWSVLLLCVSLIPLVVMSAKAFHDQPVSGATLPAEVTQTTRIILACAAGLVGFTATTALIALLQIVSGVHLLMRYSQTDIESDLAELKRRFRV